MTPAAVRKLALSLPEAREQDHWGKPSFRVRGKIFATLWVKERRAVLKLSLDEQEALVQVQPKTFLVTPWGHQGWTSVDLARVRPGMFKDLLVGAWRRVAPKRVAALLPDIRPLRRRYLLRDLLKKVTSRNLQGEVGTGAAVGRETW